MFIKSSKCESHTCVEVKFHKSTKSMEQYCVEMGVQQDSVLVRDSKDISLPWLKFSPSAWLAFVASL